MRMIVGLENSGSSSCFAVDPLRDVIMLLVTHGRRAPRWDALLHPNYRESFIGNKKLLIVDVFSRRTFKMT